MKRWASLILVLILLFSCTTVRTPISNGEQTEPTPEAYDDDEFPQWSKDLRRGEIILLGSLPLVYMLTNLAYDNIMKGVYQGEGENLSFSDNEHTLNKVTIAISASAVISLTDYLLGLRERKQQDD